MPRIESLPWEQLNIEHQAEVDCLFEPAGVDLTARERCYGSCAAAADLGFSDRE